MENENKNCEKKNGCGKTLAIIAIVLSIISITASAFTLGNILNNQKNAMPNVTQNCPMQNGCPMPDNCPMQNGWQNNWGGRWQNRANDFSPMWSMFNNNNRMNNFWQNNRRQASASNATRKRIGGSSPNNKVYNTKPVQNVEDQSPKEYKTYSAPDSSYGIQERARERQKREQAQSKQQNNQQNNQ